METGGEELRNGQGFIALGPERLYMLRDLWSSRHRQECLCHIGATLQNDMGDGLSMAWLLLGHAVEGAQA
jgi:hypothetical protein